VTNDDNWITSELISKYGESKIKNLDPDIIIRFVRGYAHEKERLKSTCERLDYYFTISEKYNFNNILNENFKEKAKCLEAWPVYMYGEDKQGHPILYDQIGNCDPSVTFKVFENDNELLKKYRFYVMKNLSISKRAQSQKYKQLIYKHIMIMDMNNFSSAHFQKKI